MGASSSRAARGSGPDSTDPTRVTATSRLEASTVIGSLGSNTTLTALNLCGCKTESDDLLRLGQQLVASKTLLRLNLARTDTGVGHGARYIADALAQNATLTNLNMGKIGLGGEGVRHLAEALAVNSGLRVLALRDNGIGPEGARHLAALLTHNSTLTRFDLGRNALGADGARHLADGLARNSTLETLHLDCCRLDAAGAHHVAEGLAQNQGLTKLLMGLNRLGDEGAKLLADALARNSTLEELSLARNGIDPDGAGFLAEALKGNPVLTSLSLGHNRLSAEGARVLAESLQVNSTLKVLVLGGNRLGDYGTRHFAEALVRNSSLGKLDLWANGNGLDAAQCFVEALGGNWSLTDLLINGDSALRPLLKRNKRFQAERFRIRRTLGDWRTVINVNKHKRYLRRRNQGQRLLLVPPQLGFAPQYRATTIDYSNPGAGTYQQRYYVDDSYFTSKDSERPVVILDIGGEGPVTGPPSGWLATMARSFGARLVALEHRYYGESIPGGVDGLKDANIVHLTVANALRDVSEFIASMRADDQLPPGTRFLTSGGSYPGALSAWFRVAHPDDSVASLSSSGVVLAIESFPEFDEVVAKAIGPDCAQVVRDTTAAMDAELQAGGQRSADLKAQFNAPNLLDNDFRYATADSVAMADQYGHKDKLCAALQPSQDSSVLIKQLADFTNGFWGADFTAGSFYDTQCLSSEACIDDWQPTSRAWRYQKCSELAYLQVAPAQNPLRSPELTLQVLIDQCRTIFSDPTMAPSVDAINTAYGGAAPDAPRTFFSHGSDDPWQAAGVQAGLGPLRPEYTARCDGCGHCKDLHAPSDADPSVIRHQRQLEMAFIQEWLDKA